MGWASLGSITAQTSLDQLISFFFLCCTHANRVGTQEGARIHMKKQPTQVGKEPSQVRRKLTQVREESAQVERGDVLEVRTLGRKGDVLGQLIR